MGPLIGGRPLVRYDPAKTNIVFAGNSIVYGDQYNGITTTWPYRLQLLEPINNAINVANLGHNGWGITALDGAGDTGPLFVDGKTNLLLFYEGTNTLKDGTAASVAISRLQTYITNRLAEHAWKIVLVSTLPFIEGATDPVANQVNAQVDQFNATIKANYKSMGAVAYIDVRTGAPWGSLPNYNLASFQATCSGIYNSDYTHPNAAGNQLLADLMAPQLRRIPLR